MASITSHFEKAHPSVKEKDRNKAMEDGPLKHFHSWLHEEYAENPHEINHTHDEHGQIIFHDRRT
jgi:hypothetical protein